MQTIAKQIYDCGIVPVVKLDRAEDAVPLANALIAGGMRCIDVYKRQVLPYASMMLPNSSFIP